MSRSSTNLTLHLYENGINIFELINPETKFSDKVLNQASLHVPKEHVSRF